MIRKRPTRLHGFTLFECIVAMFILLIGLLGVVTMFSVGMNQRLQAQELVMSQELANMWASWIRFRLDDSTGGGGFFLATGDLTAGKKGDFFQDAGDFHAGAGSLKNLPTLGANTCRGYTWEITDSRAFTPGWLPEDSTAPLDWDKTRSGGSAIPSGMGSGPKQLREVELSVFRGARRYKFRYIFSGIGMKYDKLAL